MQLSLSDHFTCKRLLRYTFPSVIMMIFTSVYGVVDGFFVSNYAGKTPFAAVNFIMPFLMILGCVGFMFGTGGSALIGRRLGEGEKDAANRIFSLIVAVSSLCGVILGVLGFVLAPTVARALGAEGELLRLSVLYARIVLLAQPFYVLQFEFQCLFATANKPRLGLFVTVAAGGANIVLDFLFVGVFHFGLVGAAVATAISQLIGGVAPLCYFARKNSSLLRLTRFRFDGKALFKTCSNGASELLSNISMSLVSMLYNMQLMKYAGENGIAAYGVLMYVSMIFQAIFIGYTVGTAPIVSYHFGADNREELKSLLRKSGLLLAVCAVFMFLAGEFLARPLARLFVGYDEALLSLTVHAFSIFSFSFLLSGFSIFGSSFFTALNNGLVSALISFLRTLVFQTAAVLLFPVWFDIDGVWLSIVAAEVMSILVTLFFLIRKQKTYGY